MSGVGFSELIILALIGLIVLGPERLPRLASQIGSWLGQARRITQVMRRQLEDELNLEKDLTLRPLPGKQLPRADGTFSPWHGEEASAVTGGTVNVPGDAQLDAAAETAAKEPAAETEEKDA